MNSSVENTHSYRKYEPQIVLLPVQQRKRMTEDQALCLILLMFFIVIPLLIVLLHGSEPVARQGQQCGRYSHWRPDPITEGTQDARLLCVSDREWLEDERAATISLNRQFGCAQAPNTPVCAAINGE